MLAIRCQGHELTVADFAAFAGVFWAGLRLFVTEWVDLVQNARPALFNWPDDLIDVLRIFYLLVRESA